jgi:class 3 adenylate cyclase/tetratricopeptide (TPR) repeat protein
MASTTTNDPWTLPELTRARRAIVVVDVVESVRLMQEDEAGFIERWRRFVHQVRHEVLPKHGGRMVKSLGDGMLLEFGSVPDAVPAALAIQHAVAELKAFHLRLGIHVGDVAVDALDIYGSGVNLAARVATLALPGEIIASADARDGMAPGVDAELEDLGECFVKHLAQPVRAFRIGPVGPNKLANANGAKTPVDWLPALAVVPPRAYGDGSDNVLGEVIADEVIAAVSKAPHVRAISRLSTRTFRDRDLDVRQVGSHLGAVYVLSGSYTANAEVLQMRAELADTRDGKVLWAGSFRTSVASLFAGDSELIGLLAAECSRTIVSEEVGRAGRRAMPTQEAYTLLMAAVHLMHRNSRTDFDRARSMLDHLIDRNPSEPVPRAWMGKWYGIRAAQGWASNVGDDARQALAHVQRALDTDPANSLAWAIKGLIHSYINKDMASARHAYESALSANPNESLAWLYSATLAAWQDDGAEAARAARTAQQLSPLDPLKYYYDSLSATAFLVAGHWDAAIALAQQSLRLNRSHTSTHRTLAIAQSISGREADANATVQELLRLDPGFTVSAFRERYPGRDSQHAGVFCDALAAAGVPR